MRTLLLFIALVLAPTLASAQDPPMPKLKALFETARSLGAESELRGDIVERLGFGDHPLEIKDLVITKDGVQHAINAFIVGDKGYLLFNSHLQLPEVYLFVRDVEGNVVAGLHGPRFQPITRTVAMTPEEGAAVVSAEDAFWQQWLSEGAKLPDVP